MTVLLASLAWLAALQEEADVVTLKDGTVRKGRIASENSLEIVLETFIRGPKGETIGSGKVTLARSDIASIERASEEARRRSAERSKAFSERGVRRAEALARIKPVPVAVEGVPGFRTAGERFELDSTCDGGFAKDVTYYLSQIFEAYGSHFGVRRNASRKIKVYLFADRSEYDRFQARRGGRVLNPAFYDPVQNFIAAYNLVQKEEERKVRGQIRQAERVMEDFKNQVAAEARRVDGLARDARQQVAALAAQKRKEIRADGLAGKDARLGQVDRWERDQLAEVKKREAELQKELEEYRRRADKSIEENRKVLEHNERALVSQNRTLFEVLFHEAFHAFAANFLWEGSEKEEFPRWLHEGMASYFEMSAVEMGELVHGAVHPAFVKLLREKAARAGLVPLGEILRGGPDVFNVTHLANADRSSVYYAQSWLLAHYLSGKVTRQEVESYVAEVLAGGDRARAFEKLAGKPVAAVEADLRAYLSILK